MEAIIQKLVESRVPNNRWRTFVGVLGMNPTDAEARREQKAIHTSPIVQSLLSRCDAAGRLNVLRLAGKSATA